jgi:transcriptional pleiotropic regulator of transition state genes
MKTTGIVRNLDNLGRVTLPIELRRNLNLDIKDPVEIFVEGDTIMLKKYSPCDIFTGEKEDLIEYHGKMVSKKSIEEMAKLAGL